MPARTLLPMTPGAVPADLSLPERLDPADDQSMQAWIDGDVAAFELLSARHRGPLYRFLLRQTRSQSLADEFFQDVWQRVIAAARGWKPEAGAAAGSDLAAVPVARDSELAPVDWLERIRLRRDAGDFAGARGSLRLLRHAHRQAVLPDDPARARGRPPGPGLSRARS